MPVIYLVLYIAAALCFLFAAVPVATARPALVPLGLLCVAVVFVIKTALGMGG